jgi:hypothetical protein
MLIVIEDKNQIQVPIQKVIFILLNLEKSIVLEEDLDSALNLE